MSVIDHLQSFMEFILLMAVLYSFVWVLYFSVKALILNGSSFSNDSLPYPEVEQAKIKVDLSEDDLTNYGGY
jgi:hypothetical protein